MSEMTGLERGYRRLVAFYPRSFRKEIASGVGWALGAVAFILAPQSWSYYERPPARRQDALV